MHKVTICGIDTSTLPKLTAKESDELLSGIAEGDGEAKERFLRANMRLVLSVVGRFSASQESADDLFQAGMVGMLKALNNFDRTLGMRFNDNRGDTAYAARQDGRQGPEKSARPCV